MNVFCDTSFPQSLIFNAYAFRGRQWWTARNVEVDAPLAECKAVKTDSPSVRHMPCGEKGKGLRKSGEMCPGDWKQERQVDREGSWNLFLSGYLQWKMGEDEKCGGRNKMLCSGKGHLQNGKWHKRHYINFKVNFIIKYYLKNNFSWIQFLKKSTQNLNSTTIFLPPPEEIMIVNPHAWSHLKGTQWHSKQASWHRGDSGHSTWDFYTEGKYIIGYYCTHHDKHNNAGSLLLLSDRRLSSKQLTEFSKDFTALQLTLALFTHVTFMTETFVTLPTRYSNGIQTLVNFPFIFLTFHSDFSMKVRDRATRRAHFLPFAQDWIIHKVRYNIILLV